MTKFEWAMVSFFGFIIAAFGAFSWIQAGRAMSPLAQLGQGHGYGLLHITYQQADYYQAGSIGAIAFGAFLAITGMILMVQAE
jgi:hypothetical protein